MEIEKLNKIDKIDIKDAAWLYFLAVVYGGKMPIKSWEKDNRMNGRNFIDSMNKFPDLVYIEGDDYFSKKEAFKIIDKFFKKGLVESIQIGLKQEEINPLDNRTYPILGIPYEYYLRRNKKVSKDFDKINDLIIKHYNSQSLYPHIINKILKVKNLGKFNLKNFINEYPDMPSKIKVYRGLKSKPMEMEDGYSAWTTSKSQGERFAKYYFTGSYQTEPIISDKSYLLETEISFSDILVYIGGYEKEIILKNPVQNVKVTDITVSK